jgi:cytidyltransferase-like protein
MKTGLYIGRFQPFHDGHRKCIEHILGECDRCVVLIRGGSPSSDNPFDHTEISLMIRHAFPNPVRVAILVASDPGYDLTVYFGREVGYKLIHLDAATEGIHATDIRAKLKEKL